MSLESTVKEKDQCISECGEDNANFEKLTFLL